MPDIAELAPQSLRPGGSKPREAAAYRAVVQTTPASAAEAVMVSIPGRDPQRRNWLYGPCPWSPRIVSDSEFGWPSKGDVALVVFTEEDEPWIVEWWPYDL